MNKILFLATADTEGNLSKNGLEALTGAKELAAALGCPLEVGIVAKDAAQAASAIAACGADAFYTVSGDAFADSRYATDAAACEAICKQSGAEMVIMPASPREARVAAGLAQRLGGKCDTQATGLSAKDSQPVITRWFYRQRMVAEMSRQDRPWVVSVAPGSFPPFEGAGTADLTPVDVAVDDSLTRTKVVGVQAPDADQQTIRPDAETLFVAGAGWTKKQADGQPHTDEAAQIILDFLDKTKSSLGSSKSLVDLSGEGQKVLPFMTHLHQVGQTGSTPRHPKGLATCCHGEEPHVVGWRFIGERRAVNLDAGCGWAQGKADVLYVADAFEVMREVLKLL